MQNMFKKGIIWASGLILALAGLTAGAMPASAQVAGNFCTQPQSISFPHGVHATTGGVDLGSISLVDGDVQSNENVVAGALAEVTGDVDAVGTIDPGLLANIGGTATEGAASLPLPSLSLPGWEGIATAGGVISGNVSVPVNGSMNLGPNQIDGNLTLEANSTLTLDGPLYITGDLLLEENSVMQLGVGFTSGGTLVIVEGSATIDGNADITGNGASAPVLLVSKSSGTAIDVGGNFATNSVVFLAGSGTVLVGDNAEIIAAYGERVEIGANAQVFHAAGLVDAVFECPPVDTDGADLAMAKTVDDNTPDEGQTILYTVTVTNNGDVPASDVVVNDLLPTGTTYVSHDTNGTGTYDQATGVWTIGSLGILASASLEITATVSASAGQTVTNTASADTSSEDSNVDNDSASVDFTVNQRGGGGNNDDDDDSSSSSSGSRSSGSRRDDDDTTPAETLPAPQVLGAVTPAALPRTGTPLAQILALTAVVYAALRRKI